MICQRKKLDVNRSYYLICICSYISFAFPRLSFYTLLLGRWLRMLNCKVSRYLASWVTNLVIGNCHCSQFTHAVCLVLRGSQFARLFRDIANASLGVDGKMRLYGNWSPWQYFLISIAVGAGNPSLTSDS